MTGNSTQLTERAGTIIIAIVDETYGIEEGGWEATRETYRLGLEAEFGLSFEDTDIGPGASLPSFSTLLDMTIPAWALLLGAGLLAGKQVSESLTGFSEVAARIREFFKRPMYLSREGALALAGEAALKAKGGTVTSLRLVSYRVQHVGDPYDLATIERSAVIGDSPETLFLGFIRHIFELEVDGSFFRVGIDGREVTLLTLDATPER